jgi:light-harvesting complex I chlorophyll a/b binding protein 4
MKAFLLSFLFATASGLQLIRPPTAPLKNIPVFNPSNYEGGLDLSFYRESELKHGRLAMVGTLLLPILEQTHGLGIHAFQTLSEPTQLYTVFAMMMSEFYSMSIGWENPVQKAFSLKSEYQPGDFKLGLWNPDDVELMDKELNNGRLAMIAMLGMMVQELVTQQPLF